MNKINIYINGEKKLVNINCSLDDALKKMKISKNKIAIDINHRIIPKSLYKKTILKDKDKIEIVQFIGGG